MRFGFLLLVLASVAEAQDTSRVVGAWTDVTHSLDREVLVGRLFTPDGEVTSFVNRVTTCASGTGESTDQSGGWINTSVYSCVDMTTRFYDDYVLVGAGEPTPEPTAIDPRCADGQCETLTQQLCERNWTSPNWRCSALVWDEDYRGFRLLADPKSTRPCDGGCDMEERAHLRRGPKDLIDQAP